MNTQLEDIKTLCDYVTGLEEKHARDEAALKRLKERIEYFKTDIIPGHIISLGLSELKMDDGSEITIATKYFASIAEERVPAAHAWLKENGYEGVIKTSVSGVFTSSVEDQVDLAVLKQFLAEKEIDTVSKEAVHAQTLKALVRKEIESGTQIPFDLFAITVVKEVQIG